MSDPQALLLFVMFLAAVAILVGALVFVTACCYEIADRHARRCAQRDAATRRRNSAPVTIRFDANPLPDPDALRRQIERRYSGPGRRGGRWVA